MVIIEKCTHPFTYRTAEEPTVPPVARFSVRRVLTKMLSVERAAQIHKVPLDEILKKLQDTVNTIQK